MSNISKQLKPFIDKDNQIKDSVIIAPTVGEDDRGEIFMTWDDNIYNFPSVKFVQDRVSISKPNVFRGLHGDSKTWKLVQCLYGRFLLFIIDVRKDSPTFMNHALHVLNRKNKEQVLIPAGCINGHYNFGDTECIFSYKQSEPYTGTETQWTVKWDDPDLNLITNIKSAIKNITEEETIDPILSDRDKNGGSLKELLEII